MATVTDKTPCVICNKLRAATVQCKGCSNEFCFTHYVDHHRELGNQLSQTEDQYNQLKSTIDQQKTEPSQHRMIQEINQWEQKSIDTIRRVADTVRRSLSSELNRFINKLDMQLTELTDELRQCRDEYDFNEKRILYFKEKLQRLKDDLNTPEDFSIEYSSTSFINKIRLQNNRKCSFVLEYR